MRRVAAIDIGTNSTKMTVADVDSVGSLSVVFEDSEVTRLGKGVDQSRRLAENAMSQTLQAITRFAGAARGQGAVVVLSAGTSALRDAENEREFLDRAKKDAGVNIEIITGGREAHLAYAAVRSDASLGLDSEKPLLVFDIGGGSTELILGNSRGVNCFKSLDIGAVRLTERFLHTDPPTEYEFAQASQFAGQALDTFPIIDALPTVAGIGGTAVNLSSVIQHAAGIGQPEIHTSIVHHADVSGALDRFKHSLLSERRTIPGLEPARADVIIAGALILDHLLTYVHANQFTVSMRGLRYGLIVDWAKSHS